MSSTAAIDAPSITTNQEVNESMVPPGAGASLDGPQNGVASVPSPSAAGSEESVGEAGATRPASAAKEFVVPSPASLPPSSGLDGSPMPSAAWTKPTVTKLVAKKAQTPPSARKESPWVPASASSSAPVSAPAPVVTSAASAVAADSLPGEAPVAAPASTAPAPKVGVGRWKAPPLPRGVKREGRKFQASLELPNEKKQRSLGMYDKREDAERVAAEGEAMLQQGIAPEEIISKLRPDKSKDRSRYSSKYEGVSWISSQKQWLAVYTHHGPNGPERYHVGFFDNEDEAYRAREFCKVKAHSGMPASDVRNLVKSGAHLKWEMILVDDLF